MLPPTLLASSASLPVLAKSGLLFTTVLYLARGVINAIQSTSPANVQLTPVITTQDGPVQGKLAYSREGKEYWQFLSIPFAEPPVNERRFQPPVPAKPWQEIKQVTKWPSACVQFDPLFVVRAFGVEDCLFLNVFTTPDIAPQNVPVLVYFHGGAFLEGESTFYHPTFFMDHGPMVVVTSQYRLGPLGFLNFQDPNDEKYPRGNMGLKDQTLTLEWVQRNIAAFGGDPNRVTIMGDSAGAASVNFHTISPLSRGLFHRAIGTSGSSLCPWAFSDKQRKIAESYATRLGCQPNGTMFTSDDLLTCYQGLNANDLVKFQWSWSDPLLEKDEFVPSVEPVVNNDTFLSRRPIEVLRDGDANPVPYLLGVTSGEGSLRSARFEVQPELLPKLATNWSNLIGRVMFFDEDPVHPEVTRQLAHFYFKQTTRVNNEVDVMRALTLLSGDALFYEPVHSTAKYHAKTGAPTYLYYYDYRSKLISGSYSFYRAVRLSDGMFSLVKLLRGLAGDWVREKLFQGEAQQRAIYGVGHAENALQAWDALGMFGTLSDGDRKFSEEYVKTMVEFVKGRGPSFRGLAWPRVNATNLNFMPIMLMDGTGKGKVILEPFAERMKVWQDLEPFRKDRI